MPEIGRKPIIGKSDDTAFVPQTARGEICKTRNRRMPNGMYGGVRGQEYTKVSECLQISVHLLLDLTIIQISWEEILNRLQM